MGLVQGERLIGRFTGDEKGPLMIVITALHGNEYAGARAMDLVLKMLEVEPITNPSFHFKGRIIGLRGNLQAFKLGRRFLQTDMNRIWTSAVIEKIFATDIDDLQHEYKELRELIQAVRDEIADYDPHEMVVLDLHTTSGPGGIFSIVRDDLDSIRLGVELHAPVIRGMITGMEGTTVHYFNSSNFDVPVTTVVFESGRHTDPASINRAIAGIINCMRTTGMVQAADVENQHDAILIEHSRDLPKVAHLKYVHKIGADDQFEMLPGFSNFDRIKKGMVLAMDRHGDICAQCDGLLLMPKYQVEGSDGFFIIQESDTPEIRSMLDELDLHFSTR